MINIIQKKCSICKVELDIARFSLDKKRGYYHSACKKCEHKRYQERIEKDPVERAKRNERQRIDSILRRKAMSEKINRIKMASGCFICGYKDYATSLVFHHLDPTIKEDKISALIGRSILSRQEELFKEIDKCVVLCGNCHTALHRGFIHIPDPASNA